MSDAKPQLESAPHPMVGLVSVIPIPAPSEDKPAEFEQTTVQFGPFNLPVLSLNGEDPDVIAGIVLEIGEIPSQIPDNEDICVPYAKGSTVFYYESRAIKLGGFHLVPMNRIFAWQGP